MKTKTFEFFLKLDRGTKGSSSFGVGLGKKPVLSSVEVGDDEGEVDRVVEEGEDGDSESVSEISIGVSGIPDESAETLEACPNSPGG